MFRNRLKRLLFPGRVGDQGVDIFPLAVGHDARREQLGAVGQDDFGFCPVDDAPLEFDIAQVRAARAFEERREFPP